MFQAEIFRLTDPSESIWPVIIPIYFDLIGNILWSKPQIIDTLERGVYAGGGGGGGLGAFNPIWIKKRFLGVGWGVEAPLDPKNYLCFDRLLVRDVGDVWWIPLVRVWKLDPKTLRKGKKCRRGGGGVQVMENDHRYPWFYGSGGGTTCHKVRPLGCKVAPFNRDASLRPEYLCLHQSWKHF